jgi:small-conductance mechanosensitive channel
MTSLREAGFKLSVFLGAAGILTVALGFASQTSATNLISGLF